MSVGLNPNMLSGGRAKVFVVLLAGLLSLFVASCSDGEEVPQLTPIKPVVDPTQLLASIPESEQQCVTAAYTPEELAEAIGKHLEQVHAGSETIAQDTPLAAYFSCFPLDDAGAESASLGLVRSLVRTFEVGETPPFDLVRMPDGVADVFVFLRGLPGIFEQKVFNGDTTQRDIRYVDEETGEDRVLLRAAYVDPASGRTAADLMIERLFLTPPGTSGADYARMAGGVTEGLFWAYGLPAEGVRDEGQLLIWAPALGQYVWSLWLAPGEDRQAFFNMLLDTGVRVLN